MSGILASVWIMAVIALVAVVYFIVTHKNSNVNGNSKRLSGLMKVVLVVPMIALIVAGCSTDGVTDNEQKSPVRRVEVYNTNGKLIKTYYGVSHVDQTGKCIAFRSRYYGLVQVCTDSATVVFEED